MLSTLYCCPHCIIVHIVLLFTYVDGNQCCTLFYQCQIKKYVNFIDLSIFVLILLVVVMVLWRTSHLT